MYFEQFCVFLLVCKVNCAIATVERFLEEGHTKYNLWCRTGMNWHEHEDMIAREVSLSARAFPHPGGE